MRTILITGTSSGIGKCMAEYYSALGFRVIGCSRREVKSCHYDHIVCDVADSNGIKYMFSYLLKNYKKLDVLINNAGVASMNHCLTTPMSTVERIFRTNVFGLYDMSCSAAKMMNRGGRIVNMSSIATPLYLEGESVYAASKSAVESLTKVMAKEFADLGITVNAVGASPIKTDLIKGVPEEKMDSLIGQQILKRYATYEDVINIVDFFISPTSGMVTGQIVYLGGVS